MNVPRLHKIGSGGGCNQLQRKGVLAISLQGSRQEGTQNRLLSCTSPVTRLQLLADEYFVASRMRRFRR